VARLGVLAAILVALPVLPCASAPISAATSAPVIGYSSFLGGSGNDGVEGMASGPDGSTYLAGWTASDDLATTDSLQPLFGGVDPTCDPPCTDAFVARVTAAGDIVYLTYLGGSRSERAYDIAVDAAGYAYVTGSTMSADFPLRDPLQPDWHGGQAYGDAFIAKLAPDGSSLSYATYLGGHSGFGDAAFGIEVDSAGRAYVAGYTDSYDFPTTDGAFDEACELQANHACQGEAFVARLSVDGSSIDWATLLGGEPIDTDGYLGLDYAKDLALASDGSVVVAGETLSSNFPATASAFDTSTNGWDDMFVASLAADGESLNWATYLGGEYSDDMSAVVLDEADRPMVVGRTQSRNFPITADAHERHCNGYADVDCHPYGDGFFTILGADGSHLDHSTFLGGAQYETANAIARDDDGSVWITGGTASIDFETRRPVQSGYAGLGCFWAPCHDVFVRQLLVDTWQMGFSTFLGAFDEDAGNAIALAGDSVVVGGYTASEEFPVANAFDATCGPSTAPDCGPDPGPETRGDGFTARLEGVTSSDNTAPTVRPPVQTMTVGSTLGSRSIPVRVAWSASDTGTGIWRYELRQSADGGAWTTISTKLTATSVTRSLLPGHHYRFGMRAVDRAGNVSAWVSGPTFLVSAYQESRPAITYSGTWHSVTSAAYYGGKMRSSWRSGAKASFSFTGRTVAWIAGRGPTRGAVRVYVDGAYVRTVNLYAATSSARRVMFSRSWSASGSHRVTLSVVGSAGHPRSDVDAFVTLR
jgi:hypothetical protein